MTLSRKDFFRQSFFSLGKALLKVGGNLQEGQNLPRSTPDDVESEREPVLDRNMVARAVNQHCLAKNCGCFCCVERCNSQAIIVVMGEGIQIDEALCTGCGTCEYICPVTPKALQMVRKEQDQSQEMLPVPAYIKE